MSTLADELLNDFEDSGSEDEGQAQNGLLHDDAPPVTNGIKPRYNGFAQMDVDEEEDEDQEMGEDDSVKLEDIDDEEEAKAKVEKMQLGGVNDVRNIAGLMKTLEPVLEVRSLFFTTLLRFGSSRFTSLLRT